MQLLSARPPCDNEARVFENAQMLHDTKAGHLQLGLELRERAAVSHEEPVEQESPRGICERLEYTIIVGHGCNM